MLATGCISSRIRVYLKRRHENIVAALTIRQFSTSGLQRSWRDELLPSPDRNRLPKNPLDKYHLSGTFRQLVM
jgi:hypothetical protein